MTNVSKILEWRPPADWLEIKTIDVHTGGEPLRIIIDGYPLLSGETILEKRQCAKENFDYIRKALMLEPRGHANMYGAIITEPETNEADFGVIFITSKILSTSIFISGFVKLTFLFIFCEMIFEVSFVISLLMVSPPLILYSALMKSSLSMKSEFKMFPSINVEHSNFSISVMILFVLCCMFDIIPSQIKHDLRVCFALICFLIKEPSDLFFINFLENCRPRQLSHSL